MTTAPGNNPRGRGIPSLNSKYTMMVSGDFKLCIVRVTILHWFVVLGPAVDVEADEVEMVEARLNEGILPAKEVWSIL